MTKFYIDPNGKYIGGYSGVTPPNDSIEILNPPISAVYVWDFSANTFVLPPSEVAKAAQLLADKEAVEFTKADATVRYLVTHTPQECYDKVMTDVGSLAQAKEMMARMAMALSAIARKQLR